MSGEISDELEGLDSRLFAASDDSEVDFRMVVEMLDTGVTKIDPASGRIYYANPAFCRMVGYSPNELSDGQFSFVEFTHPEDLEKNLELQRQFNDYEIDQFTIEKRYIRKDGSIFWARTTAKHLPRTEGGQQRTIGIIEDITEQMAVRSAPWQATVSPPDVNQRLKEIRLKPAEAFIRTHWKGPLRVQDIARACELSPRMLFREFRKVYGCPPAAYVKRVRLTEARNTLLRGDRKTSIVALALSAGFMNASHFARDYRKTFGELPSETLKVARLAALTSN